VLQKSDWAGQAKENWFLPSTAVFSSDGRRVGIATLYGASAVWDVTTSKVFPLRQGMPIKSQVLNLGADDELSVRDGQRALIQVAGFSARGDRFYTLDSRTLQAWDPGTGKELKAVVLKPHEGGFLSACFSGDGERCLVTTADRTAGVWESATAREIAVLRGHDD